MSGDTLTAVTVTLPTRGSLTSRVISADSTRCSSDSSIAKLQASRLAREASPVDNITTNVVSVDEAERLIEERYRKLSR